MALRSVNRASLEHQIHDDLRIRILEGELGPGAILDLRQLSSDYDVSVTPVRQALRLLAKAGLITMSPGSSAKVTTFDYRDISFYLDSRLMIETYAARYGVSNFTSETERWLNELVHETELMPEAIPDELWGQVVDRGTQFHSTLVALLNNPVTERIYADLNVQICIARASLSTGKSFRRDREVSEHRAIISAYLAGDPLAAEEAVRTHILELRKSMFDAIAKKDQTYVLRRATPTAPLGVAGRRPLDEPTD